MTKCKHIYTYDSEVSEGVFHVYCGNCDELQRIEYSDVIEEQDYEELDAIKIDFYTSERKKNTGSN